MCEILFFTNTFGLSWCLYHYIYAAWQKHKFLQINCKKPLRKGKMMMWQSHFRNKVKRRSNLCYYDLQLLLGCIKMMKIKCMWQYFHLFDDVKIMKKIDEKYKKQICKVFCSYLDRFFFSFFIIIHMILKFNLFSLISKRIYKNIYFSFF